MYSTTNAEVMRLGMDCLVKNLGIIDTERFISALSVSVSIIRNGARNILLMLPWILFWTKLQNTSRRIRFAAVSTITEHNWTKFSLQTLRRAAIFHKVFSDDLNKNFRAEHDLTIDDWQQKTLGGVSVTRAGYAFKSKKFTDKWKYHVIRMENLYKGKLDWSKIFVYYPESELNEQILQRALVYSDDILITLTGTKYKRDYRYTI